MEKEIIRTEDLCCDLEHSKLLAETGLMKDVSPDGIHYIDIYKKWHFNDWCDHEDTYSYYDDKFVLTYRLDKILAKLPEWVFASYKHDALRRLGVDYNSEIGRTILSRMYEISIFRVGQAAANASAKLLHLLWKEKLI